MTLPDDKRQTARRRGQRAERVAALYMMLKGYRVLARNYTIHGGELDLVVCRGNVVAFVEVKRRADWQAALEAITPLKQHRVARAARHWLARNGWATQHTIRCDAIFVTPRTWPRHLTDVFPLHV